MSLGSNEIISDKGTQIDAVVKDGLYNNINIFALYLLIITISMEKNPAVTRWFYILASIFIVSLIVWNTMSFFNTLKENERTKMQIWAAAQGEVSQQGLNVPIGETALEVIRINTTTPMIVHVEEDDSYSGRNIDSLALQSPEKRQQLIEQYVSEYKPLEVYDRDQLLQTIYYGNSPIINKLKYYPAVLILIMFLFFAAIYFFNKTAKSSEQNRLWAGMAKETAHQIGTPLSSLLGWIAILKAENISEKYIDEIENDVHRLNIIANRFSKIGSAPELKKNEIVSITRKSFDYLKRKSSKQISFEFNADESELFSNINVELFGWVIENLVRNAIDAMKGKGSVSLTISEKSKAIEIIITDTGKGILKSQFKQIFKPGFTTKKRGWGLGLSLSKRIVEEYHNGKIFVKKSEPNKGTSIQILLYKA